MTSRSSESSAMRMIAIRLFHPGLMQFPIPICLVSLEGNYMSDNPKAILLELYPANVVGAPLSREYREVLAVVTDQKIYVATDDPTGRERYVVAFEAPIYDITGSGLRRTWSVTLDDDNRTEITVTRSNGCGCGSKLRGARMFRGVPYKRVI